MSVRRADQFERWFGWRVLLALGAVGAAVLTVIAVARCESSSDFRDFWRTAAAFRETGVIRDDLGVHNYLPFFTIFMTPWALLPLPVATGAFTLLSLMLMAATVVMTEVLLRGELGAAPSAASWATLLLIGPYAASSAVLGQVNLLVLFLVVATWLLVERGREWIAGLPLALAILIKLMPAALLPFLLLTRRWRTGLAAVAATLVLGVGWPLMSLGPSETLRQHQAYYRRAVVEHSARTTIESDKPRKARFTNQSLPIVLRRLLSRVNADPDDAGSTLFVNVADLPGGVILAVYAGLLAVVVGGTVAASGVRLRSTPETDDLDAQRRSLGLWLCTMLVASPLLWTHYLVLAWWPLACVAYHAERFQQRHDRPHRAALLGLAAWAAAALLLVWPAARACGAQLGGVLVVWCVLAWLQRAARVRPTLIS